MLLLLLILLIVVVLTINASTIIDSNSNSNSNINNWPIIGLFAQPTQKTDKACGGSCQYIAASYVKYLG